MTARPRRHHIWLLAGWLFADLALALFVVSLGAADDASSRAVASSVRPSASPSAKPPAAKKQGLRKTPLKIRVRTSLLGNGSSAAGRAKARTALRKELRKHTGPKDRAALVETFGASPDVHGGTTLAAVGNKLLEQVAPSLAPRSVPKIDYWDGSHDVPSGTITFQMWLYQ